MSNLYNQNIGINYKGILNLDTTINTPLDATLRAVTDGAGTSSLLQLSTEAVGLSRTVNLSAGATTPRLFNVVYTINNSGAQTGTLTGLFLNATETALNGMTHNLMELQVDGFLRFRVGRVGDVDCKNVTASQSTGFAYFGWGGQSKIGSRGDGVILLANNALTDFNRLQLGGTTSSFPAIKRNGAGIDFRLADDSAACDISASNVNLLSYIYKNATTNARFTSFNNGFVIEVGASTTLNGSSILDLNSTTRGFLMPRMTQAQILLILTPANGLQVYNTDINTPCFYDGGALLWKKVSHSNM